MTSTNAVIAVYSTHAAAKAAVKELEISGFEMKQLSIIGQHLQINEQVLGFYNLDDRMRTWGKAGAFWGGVWGLLFGSAFLWVPGLGSVLVAGSLVAGVVAALESALVVGGLSIIGAALYNLGIPKDSILRYERALKTGQFVLIAHGSPFNTTLAREILSRTGPETLDLHEQAANELRSIPLRPL